VTLFYYISRPVLSIRCNNTGEDKVISYCWFDHWGDHGDHDLGDYEDCVGDSFSVKDGAIFVFDETELNGSYIEAACDAAGFD
jgi:hypothetical protein